ncbi:unnamed protein product [Sphenostylis stenocarpa]|uniref:Signal recognition particle 19 kDa protein n=1 Tax=Sphenostylis stenocarpa TaxID=92480 RepID=A0AA86SDT5_9FABA|nr:unnamed protein product [Sphenostylis stenocarpa]
MRVTLVTKRCNKKIILFLYTHGPGDGESDWAGHYRGASSASLYLLLIWEGAIAEAKQRFSVECSLLPTMEATELPNIKKWIVLYPVYINSKKTMAEGRRIAVAKACENPMCAEIGDCCSYLKLPYAIEIDKAYPRDFMQRGRVRVLLKKEDGTFYNPSISSRKQLMLRVAEMVPRHHGRTKKQETASTSTTGPSNKSGKGGRKRR